VPDGERQDVDRGTEDRSIAHVTQGCAQEEQRARIVACEPERIDHGCSLSHWIVGREVHECRWSVGA
jgi:hypothetical protein